MFERIHQKLGTAGFIISIVALVAALGGGAYAATGNGAGKATASAKAKQGPRGKTGKTGKTGPAGPAGPQGPAGTKGDTGASGAEGKQGPKGDDGEEGPEGSPWTLGGKLPSGATETGTWSASGLESGEAYVPISFPIPLEAQIAGAKAHLVPAGGEAPCMGSNAEPTAPKAELCIYKTEFSGATSGGIWDTSVLSTGTGTTGAFLILEGLTSSSQAYGTWAVTER